VTNSSAKVYLAVKHIQLFNNGLSPGRCSLLHCILGTSSLY